MIKGLLRNIIKKSGYRFINEDFLNKYYHNNNDPKYRLSGDLNPLEQLFYKYITDDFFFIQIGANNGQRFDPIHHLLVREKELIKGIAIEPVQEYFEELKLTYKDFPQIKLLKTAIHNADSEAVVARWGHVWRPVDEGRELVEKGRLDRQVQTRLRRCAASRRDRGQQGKHGG